MAPARRGPLACLGDYSKLSAAGAGAGLQGAAKAYGEGQADQRHSQQGGGACDGVVDGGDASCARVGHGADRGVGQRRNRERQAEPEQQDTWQHVST